MILSEKWDFINSWSCLWTVY